MKVFLAAPFTDRIDQATGRVSDAYREWLENIATVLRRLGHGVVCAHERENWGSNLDPPEVAIRLDWEAIAGCDLLVAYVGNPPSPGVQMEIGYASALKKPMILMSNTQSPLPYLARGLGEVTMTIQITFEESEEAAEILSRAVESLLSQSPDTG